MIICVKWNSKALSQEQRVLVAISLGYRRTQAAAWSRKTKIGWLPEKLHKSLRDCVADGWALVDSVAIYAGI